MADLKLIALQIIEIIDYDIYKECLLEIGEEGGDATVNELISYLEVLLDQRPE